MSPSEAGRVGYIKSKLKLDEASVRRKETALAKHENAAPSCCLCGERMGYEKRRNKFCSHSCAAKYNNRGVARHQGRTGIAPCRRCGQPILNSGRMFCGVQCANARVSDATERKLTGDPTGTPVSARAMRSYLVRTRGERCELCGWSERNPTTQRVPVEVDHIDGNAKNSHIANLRLICPNCHSLTPTFRNLNKGHGRDARRKRPLSTKVSTVVL